MNQKKTPQFTSDESCQLLTDIQTDRRGNALVVINEATLRRARLILGWMTVCGKGKPSRYVTSHPGQLSLAIPPWVGAMSTSESWGVNRHTRDKLAPYPWSHSVSWCLAED